MSYEPKNNTQFDTKGSPLKLDVTVRPIVPKGNLLGFASVKIADCFVLVGVKVLTGEKGLFINMPSAKDNKGEYHDICFPITADFRKQLSMAVLAGYETALEKQQTRDTADKPSIMNQVKVLNKDSTVRNDRQASSKTNDMTL